MLRDAPDDSADAVSQIVHGEIFHVVDIAGGWAWGRCGHDDYVGYLPEAALGGIVAASHRVTAVLAPVHTHAGVKAAVSGYRPIGTRFAGRPCGDFLETDAGYIHVRHAAPIGETACDPVAIAQRLFGQPYLWGGRGAGGIDCSGLVQVALGLCGIAAPRDSDMQRDRLGSALADGDALRRGDLIFFPGHVGLMTDEINMIHATAHVMAVTIEPLADVVARLAPDHARPIVARRRL